MCDTSFLLDLNLQAPNRAAFFNPSSQNRTAGVTLL
jgi:hypothetical protein